MKGIKHGMGSKLMGLDDKPDASDEGDADDKPKAKKSTKPKVPVAKIKGLK